MSTEQPIFGAVYSSSDFKAETPEDDVVEQAQDEMSGISAFIHDRWRASKDKRRIDEIRWTRALNDYRGNYDGSVSFRDTERSRVFVKIAKTKTIAAYGQLVEVVFAANKFPLEIVPTEKPTGIAKDAHLEKQGEEQPEIPTEFDVGFPGDGKRESERTSFMDPILSGLKALYNNASFASGKSHNPEETTIHPAAEAAKNMTTTVVDQLTESHASTKLREALFESALYGTGIIKGPMSYKKEQIVWKESEHVDGEVFMREYDVKTVLVPKIDSTSVWNFYPQPSATDMENLQWCIERHKLTESQMIDLAKHPGFSTAALEIAVARGPNYTPENYEDNVRDSNTPENTIELFEVLEYWGVLNRRMARASGLDFDDEKFGPLVEIPVNVWIYQDQILRIIENPFKPARIPYHVFPY